VSMMELRQQNEPLTIALTDFSRKLPGKWHSNTNNIFIRRIIKGQLYFCTTALFMFIS
jgi:hypothetical protein